MFLRLAAQYQDLVKDLVLTLQALAESLQEQGGSHLLHLRQRWQTWRLFRRKPARWPRDSFLVCDQAITWVEMRNGVELVKLEGAEAISELDRLSQQLRHTSADVVVTPASNIAA